MKLSSLFWLCVAACPVWAVEAAVEFNQDVRPILSDRCFACHGPDAGNRKSKLRLDREADAKADLGKGRFGLIAGDPEHSEVLRRVISPDKARRMPPAYAGHEALTANEVDVLRRWIVQGAAYQAHWSYLPPQRSALPAVSRPDWPRNAIDRFVLSRLDREGLAPAAETDKARLLRRVTLDLTGLPPTADEVNRFLQDASPAAYEQAVDRLLASPRHAERMAIRWLEAARYADTNGYQSDGPRVMWRWRDWVLDAYRRNMPFDQFTIEQLAGDLLPNATLSQKMATAFHRNHRTSAEGGIIDEEFRVDYVADRTETTAAVWMGMTVGCARCHDHKYDPIPQKDFYRLFAFFNQVPEKGFVYNFGNEEPYIKAPTPDQEARLAELDRAVMAAQDEVQRLEPERVRQQEAWEKRLARKSTLRWNIEEGLTFQSTGREAAAGCEGTCRVKREPGPGGEAVRFEGKLYQDAGISVAKFNHRDPFTFAAWVKPDAPRGAILSRAEDYWEGTGHGLYVVDGKLRLHVIFRWTDLGMRVETVEPLQLHAWQHVAVTYDGNMKAAGVQMYVDGRPQELKILFDQNLWPLESKEPFRIGAGGGLRFQGALRDVRVYNRALPAAEAAVLPLLEPVNQLAAIPPGGRTAAQNEKLRLCFNALAPPPAYNLAVARLAQARAARKTYDATVPTLMVMQDAPEARDTFVLKRGAYDAHGDKVTAQAPSVLPALSPDAPKNRLGLARWLVSRENPLTARVTVNRFWQMLFGTGLVKTVEDFGSQGEWPLHPELLDWLAVEFMDSGWDVRHVLKTIVMSATYRQSSQVTPELLQRDPENRLLARGPRLRLAPEMVRDQALAASGLLVEKVGGPSVKPYQPPGLWKELQGGQEYAPDQGEGLYRRTLYTYWRRTIAPPMMVTFDSPNRETCTVRETRTNTPLQALYLMNDVTYVEAARKLGERMVREGGGTAESRVRYGFARLLARQPDQQELAVLTGALTRFQAAYEHNAAAADALLHVGAAKPAGERPAPEAAAYAAVASLLLNLDEAITKD